MFFCCCWKTRGPTFYCLKRSYLNDKQQRFRVITFLVPGEKYLREFLKVQYLDRVYLRFLSMIFFFLSRVLIYYAPCFIVRSHLHILLWIRNKNVSILFRIAFTFTCYKLFWIGVKVWWKLKKLDQLFITDGRTNAW